MFSKDDHVFYESGGICRILDVQVSPLDGMPADKTYYVLQSMHDNNGLMYVPVDNETVFLRLLMNREEANALIEEIAVIEPIKEPNAKMLRNRYVDAMRTHQPREWVRVIKTVQLRMNSMVGRAQRISETERSFYENAKRFLKTELALAFEWSEEQASSVLQHHFSVEVS